MTPPAPAVFFLSDYGTADEFVGVVHAVLHRLAPNVPVIDLSHQIAPFDVAGGAAMLVRCAPHLGAGVVLAVVDPGVGTARRSVAVRTVDGGTGSGGPSWLVGPDNGLLAPMATACGGVGSAFAIDRDAVGARPGRTAVTGPAGPGPTFDGRDVFAPAAARLALGTDPGSLGTPIDPASLVAAPAGPHPLPGSGGEPEPPGPGFLTSVASIDRFGNVQLEAGAGALAAVGIRPGGTFLVTVLTGMTGMTGTAGMTGTTGTSGPPPGPAAGPPAGPQGPIPGRRVAAFAELGQDELGLLVDGSGHLALVLDRTPATARLDPIGVGSRVLIAPGPAGPA